MFPGLVVLTKPLCFVVVYVRVFTLTKYPVLTNRAYFYAETAWGCIPLG